MKGSHREEFRDVSPMQLKSVVIPTSGAHVFLLQSNEPAEARLKMWCKFFQVVLSQLHFLTPGVDDTVANTGHG